MIWVISDTHFDHGNIIEYASRPFVDAADMNTKIWANIASVVKDKDTLLVLGDVSFGRGSRSAAWWLERLPGRKILIKGSHDSSIRETSEMPEGTVIVCRSLVLRLAQVDYYLVHRPEDALTSWQGWVIHGHVHNAAPFICTENRRINVSCEAINYTPVSIERIMSEVQKATWTNRSAPS